MIFVGGNGNVKDAVNVTQIQVHSAGIENGNAGKSLGLNASCADIDQNEKKI